MIVKKIIWLPVAVSMGLVYPLINNSSENEKRELYVINKQTLEQRIPLAGTIRAQNPVPIFSTLSQSATILKIAPEGKLLEADDLVVRFDTSAIEREALRIEKNMRLAEAEYLSLKEAELPLQKKEIEQQLREQEFLLEQEQKQLTQLQSLFAKDLLSAHEVTQQEQKLKRAELELTAMQERFELTTKHIHPRRLSQAETQYLSAKKEWEYIQKDLQNTSIAADSSGFVIYQPIMINGKLRSVQVGDNVYRNQTFIWLNDPNDWKT